MKYLTTLLFSVFVFAFLATSQETDEEINDLLNNQEIKVENPIIRDLVSMSQIQNDFVTNLQKSGLIVEITQNGNRNSGMVEQVGSGLETHLVQVGSVNEAKVWSEGDNILTSIEQDGNGNFINSYIKNYHLDKRSAILLQEGNNNRIDLALFGDGIPTTSFAQEVKITQQGNNHMVEAFMEDSFAPIEITQDAGINGEGMQLKVSNSFFDFTVR